MLYQTHSEDETKHLGEHFSHLIPRGQICLFGEMGSGKTAFVKGFMQGLNYNGEVTSPTFALCHRYDADKIVYHYDLYRLSGYDDLYTTGLFDLPDDAIVLLEWSENAEGYLDQDAVKIYFSYGPARKTVIFGRRDRLHEHFST